MMDIGMYGHGQHNSPYGTTGETNFYNYSPGDATSYPQSHGTGHQIHQHYPSIANYQPAEEAPSYLYSGTEGSETSSPGQDLHYYQQQQQQHHHHQTSVPHQDPNPSIISTESGLSYTNLDYGPVSNPSNNLYLNSHQNLYHTSESYPRSNPHEMMVHRHHGDLQENQTLGHQNHFLNHDSKYLPQIGCENETPYPHIVMQNSATNACMEYPHHRYKEDPGLPPTDGTGDCVQTGHILHHRPHHGLHHLQPAPAPPTVPTYKWMQVKRNVPKPAGKCNVL